MEKTANTDVDQDQDFDQDDVSSSSLDKKQEFEEMSAEELKAELLKEREAKHQAIQHLRDQELKRKSQLQQESEKDSEETKEDISDSTRKIIREELQKSQIESLTEDSMGWLHKQEFAKSLFEESAESDKLYIQYSKELAHLSSVRNIKTKEDYQKLMRLAMVNVTGKPDALIQEESAEQYINNDKSNASGYRGSVLQKTVSYPKMSIQDQSIINRINVRRKDRGEKELTAGEVTEILNN